MVRWQHAPGVTVDGRLPLQRETDRLRVSMIEACDLLREGDEFAALRALEAALLQETGD